MCTHPSSKESTPQEKNPSRRKANPNEYVESFYTDQELEMCSVIPKGIHEIFIFPFQDNCINLSLTESVLNEKRLSTRCII